MFFSLGVLYLEWKMAVNLDSSGEEADAGNVVLSYPDYQVR